MNTTIRTIYAAAVVLATVSCQKSIEPANPAEEGKETIDICVNGLMGEYTQVDGTRASLVNNVRVSWEGGETVYVYDGTQCLGSLAASLEGTEDRYAILSTDGTHTVSTPAAGTTTLTLVYSPLLTEAPAVSGGAISISLAGQSGKKAPFVAFATLEYTSTTIKNVVVPCQFATSVIKVNCTGLKASTAITSATLSNVNTVCKLSLSGAGVQNVSGDVNGTITRTGDEYFSATNVNSEGEAVFQIAVPKLETASGARVLTVAQSSDKVKDKKFTTKSLDPATSVNTVCQLFGPPAGALAGEFSVSNDGGATIKQVHFSQGNLYWNGNAFQFEANQYSYHGYDSGSYTWDLFGWSTEGKNYGMNTSINYSDYSGNFYDWGKAIGDGNTWRTLTHEEWCYLFAYDPDNYDFIEDHPRRQLFKYGVTVCGKPNCVVLLPDEWNTSVISLENFASTSNYSEETSLKWSTMEAAGAVCLPAAGTRDGSNVFSVGDFGYYWSSTASDVNYAYGASFFSYNVLPGNYDFRNYGCSVRLITESK